MLFRSKVLVAGPTGAWRLDGDSLVPIKGMPETDDGEGGPGDGIHNFQFVRGPSGEIWLATWEGLFRSDDEGVSVHEVFVLPTTVHKGVAFDEGPILAGYGSGLHRDGVRLDATSPVSFLREVLAEGAEIWENCQGGMWQIGRAHV